MKRIVIGLGSLLLVAAILAGATACGGEPVGVEISGPTITAVWDAHVTLKPTNATENDVTYVVTVADQSGKQRGSWQVVWREGEARNYKSGSFQLTPDERQLYTGPGPDGMGQDLTSKFTITITRR